MIVRKRFQARFRQHKRSLHVKILTALHIFFLFTLVLIHKVLMYLFLVILSQILTIFAQNVLRRPFGQRDLPESISSSNRHGGHQETAH